MSATEAASLFVSLLVLVNPALVVPIFLHLTPGYTPVQRRAIATGAAVTVLGIFAGSVLAGAQILDVLGIQINALRAAGGVLLTLMAIGMIWPRAEASGAAHAGQSPAMVPLGFPLLAGPGSMAVLIGQAADFPGDQAHLALLGVSAAIAAVALVALMLAQQLYRLLGDAGLDVMSRLMGMLLLGIGLQMLADGLGGLLPGLH